MKTRKGFLQRRGKTWYAVWFVAGKRFAKTTGQTDKRDATKRLAEIMQPFLVEDDVKTLQNVKAYIEGAKGELSALDEKKNPPITLDQAWGAYLAAPKQRDPGKRTLADYAAYAERFNSWVKKTHPDLKNLRDVTKEIALGYVTDLNQAGLSAGSYNKHRGFLLMLFDLLEEKARLTLNPWKKTPRREDNQKHRRELTLDELKRVCVTTEGDMRMLLALGLFTGLRLGDCCTLRWSEVDLIQGIINRIPRKTSRKGEKVEIPIHATLRTLLEELPAAEHKDFVLPDIAKKYLLNPWHITHRIQAHFNTCGIITTLRAEGTKSITEVGFHSLRHTFVSLCVRNGVPNAVLKAMTGHSTQRILDSYTHVETPAKQLAVNALPPILPTNKAAKPLPDPTQKPTPSLLGPVPIRVTLESMTAENWKAKRNELLALLDSHASP